MLTWIFFICYGAANTAIGTLSAADWDRFQSYSIKSELSTFLFKLVTGK